MPDIWNECNAPEHIKPLSLSVIRVVESQEQIATMGLVDSADEQLILEQLIETSKPAVPASRKKGKDYHYLNSGYLIQTAFRYPPLEHGSRFGRRTEPSLFYASVDIETALAETAYYRVLFWQGMLEPPPKRRIDTQHTSFRVTFRTKFGMRLEAPPFTQFRSLLIHKADYQATHTLGSQMREAGIEAFTFNSARNQPGVNAAAFNIDAIINRPPAALQQWVCTTMESGVNFLNQNEPGMRFTF